jgi:two-component system, cell cycle response regulator
MSLRVLLADESASIRKVFQLGLQDFGAEVKSVHNGLDVVEVALSFKPHIVFADVLLQKKNGYEVCVEINQNDQLKKIPVILMWSSFMELDQKKYNQSGAIAELEKPFDIEIMRKLIQQYVEQTKQQQISQFLEFPDSIKKEFIESQKTGQNSGLNNMNNNLTLDIEHNPESDNDFQLQNSAQEEYPYAESTSVFNLQTEDANFDLAELEKVPAPPKTQEEILEISDGGNWTTQPLTDQKMEPHKQKDEDLELEQFQTMDLQKDKKLNLEDFLYRPESTNALPPPKPEGLTGSLKIHNVNISPENTQAFKISNEETEMIIRQETRSLIQKTISEQLPKMLEKVIREELQKVLEQEMAIRDSESKF